MASSHRRLRDLYLQCTNKYRCWGTCIGWALRSVVVSQSAEICRDDLHVNSVCLWSRAISIYPTCSARVLCRQQNFYPLYNKFWRLKALLLLSGKIPVCWRVRTLFFFSKFKDCQISVCAADECGHCKSFYSCAHYKTWTAICAITSRFS